MFPMPGFAAAGLFIIIVAWGAGFGFAGFAIIVGSFSRRWGLRISWMCIVVAIMSFALFCWIRWDLNPNSEITWKFALNGLFIIFPGIVGNITAQLCIKGMTNQK